MYQIIKGYQKDDSLRKSFNALAMEMFHLNFEDWYQNGFWKENYIPYSIAINGKIVANISVNLTDMIFDGKIKKFIQLGTVMTAKEYRNQGLIRQIMHEIEVDFQDKVEGIYLFANDSVLEFYPKFGFRKSKEFQYETQVENETEYQLEKIVMNDPKLWKQLLDVMSKNIFHGKFDMTGNHELIMFYVTKFMQEDVYYHSESGTFIIAEIDGEQAIVHNIFSETLDSMEKIIPLFGKKIKYITLGFTPVDFVNYDMKELKDDDTTFFIKGESLQLIAKEKMRIPSLSHA